MGTLIDLTGKTFGRLTVLSRTVNDKFGKVCWLCRCSCGNIISVSSGALVTGNTKSCGCLQRDRASESNIKDLTGLRFGRLTVIKRIENSTGSKSVSSGYVQYECKCDCGNTCIVKAGNLSSGDTKSCGCLNTDRRKERAIDLTGQVFGRLTVVRRADNNEDGRVCWLCKCACGNECVVKSNSLLTGHTSSCGCLRLENLRAAITKWTPEERSILDDHFSGMIQRCYNSNNPAYHDYGGRGIKICDEWLDPIKGRRNFVEWAKANGYAHGLTIERIDVNGNYCPDNCSWISLSQQQQNKQNTVWIEVKGYKRNINQWSDFLCFPRWKLRYMYRKYGKDAVVNYIGQYVA